MKTKDKNLLCFNGQTINPDTFRPIDSFREAGRATDHFKTEIVETLQLLAKQLDTANETLKQTFQFHAAPRDGQYVGGYAITFDSGVAVLAFYPPGATEAKWTRDIEDTYNIPINAVLGCLFVLPTIFETALNFCPAFRENHAYMMDILALRRAADKLTETEEEVELPWWKRLRNRWAF